MAEFTELLVMFIVILPLSGAGLAEQLSVLVVSRFRQADCIRSRLFASVNVRSQLSVGAVDPGSVVTDTIASPSVLDKSAPLRLRMVAGTVAAEASATTASVSL